MPRRAAALALFAVLLSACSKGSPAPAAAPSSGGPSPTGGGHAVTPAGGTPAHPAGTGTGTETGTGTGATAPPPGGGWVPAPVPENEKNVDYTTVFRLQKDKKGAILVENLHHLRIGHIDVQTTWTISGGGVMEEIGKAPNETELFFRIHGSRTMTANFNAPAGMTGAKQEYTVTVGEIVWKKPEAAYFHEVTLLEEVLWDDYVIIFTSEPADMLKRWKEHQTAAIDLGTQLSDRDYDPAKKPFQPVIDSLERAVSLRAEVDKKSGDIAEATAWLRLMLEWSHFPGCPVSGDMDPKRAEEAQKAQEGRVSLLEAQLLDRLKSGGINVAPEESGKVLAATDGTITQKFADFAYEAGKTRLAAECAIAVFGAKEKPEWKQTTLSKMKQQVVANEKYFADWPDDAVAKFPARFRDAVLPFGKGQLIPTRNAAAILEALKKAKPSVAFDPKIDDVIAELKKK